MAIIHKACGARLGSVLLAYAHQIECPVLLEAAKTLAIPDRLVPLLGATTNPYHKVEADLYGGRVRRLES